MVVDEVPTAPTILGEWDDLNGLADAKRLDVAGGYAYVASPTNNSLTIINISEADNPVAAATRIDNIRLDGAFDVKVVGKYAYVSCESVLTILDVSQAAGPIIVGVTPPIGTDLRDVFIIGKYALVIVEGDNKLSVIDIEDPTNPFEANSMDLPRKPTRGYLADGFLYTAHLEGGSITTDVSDPANPFIFGESVTTVELAVCTDLFYVGGWLFVTTSDPGSLAILDVSQIQDAEVNSSLTGLGAPQTVEVYGDYAYLNDGRIIDISDRLNPVQVAQGASRDAVKMVGKFGVAVSDTKLTIFDNTGFDAATGNVGSLKAGCINVDSDLTVSNNILAHNKMNVGIGGIHCDGVLEAESITTRQLDIQGNVIGRATDPIFLGSLVDSVFEDSERLALSSLLSYIPSPTNNSITAVDFSDEINPVIVSTLKDDIDLDGAFAVVVRGMLAYVTTDSAIVELDISDPSNISINTVGTTPGTIMKSIVANAQRFYVCSQSDDILYSTKFVSSVFSVVGSVQLDRTINNMYQFENFIYTAPAGGGFHIVNIENADNPSLVTDFIDVTNLPVTNDVFVSGQFAYFSTDTGLSIYNISDKTAPVFVGKFTDSLNHESIFLSGSEAFLSNGIKVIDVGDKTNPQEVGISAVPSSESDMIVSGQTLCTVRDGEASVYNITGATLPAANIGTLFVTQLDVINNLIVGNDATFNQGITVGTPGIFTTGPIVGPNLTIDNIFIDGNTISSTDTDGDIIILPDGIGEVVIESTLDMTSQLINNVLDPVSAQDAATKNYVDTHAMNEIWTKSGSNIFPTTITDFVGVGRVPGFAFDVENSGSTVARFLSTGTAGAVRVSATTSSEFDLAISNDIRWAMQTLLSSGSNFDYLINNLNGIPTTPFFIDGDTDNVGINTITPSAQLHVVGDVIITSTLDMSSQLINNVLDPVSAQDAATKNYVDTHTANAIWTKSGTDIFQSTLTDNVGIGTNSPTEMLEVAGNILVTESLQSHRIDTTGQPIFWNARNSDNESFELRFTEEAVGVIPIDIWQFRFGGTGTNPLVFSTFDTDPILYLEPATQRVGIATTSPTAQLHVVGDAKITSTLDMTSQLINNVLDPVSAQDAATKNYVDTLPITLADGNFLVGNVSNVAIGVTPTGDVTFDNAGIFAISAGVIVNADLATGVFAAITGIGTQTQALDMGTNLINNVVDPTLAQDAATKNYVDTHEVNGIWTKSGTDIFQTTLTDSVGIGTNSPTELLQVSGNILTTESLRSNRAETTGQPVFLNITNSANAALELRFTEEAVSNAPIDIWQFRLGGTGADVPIAFYLFDTTPLLFIDPDGSVGITTNAPDTLASLDLVSTTKGFLAPRMTTTQKDAIVSPPQSLVLNDTDLNKMDRYSGVEWRSFATQGDTTREAWAIEDFPAAVSNVITINSGLTRLKKTISTADRFAFGDNQNVTLDGTDPLNLSLIYTGTETFYTSTSATFWRVREFMTQLSGNNATGFNIDTASLRLNSAQFIFSGTGGTIGTFENSQILFMRDLFVQGYENGLTFQDVFAVSIDESVFRSNTLGTGPTINIKGFLGAPVQISSTSIIISRNESGFFIDPQIRSTVNIENCSVPIGDFFETAPEGEFSAASDEGETTAVISVSDGITNAIFAITGSFTNVIDGDTIVHTGFSESTYNGTFEIFNIAGSAYEVRDLITSVPIAFVADDTGSGTTSLTRFTSADHGLDGSEDVTVTSDLYASVGSTIRGTPLTNSFDLIVEFNGDDSGIWQVDVQPFSAASDLSESNAITSVEAVAFGTRFVSTVALSGLQDDDIVTHSGFTQPQYNGEFRITNVLTNSYDVVFQPAQFSVTDTGTSDSNLTRFDIISHGLTVGIGVQLKSTLYNEGGRVRQLLNNSIDVSVAFKGTDVGTININSLDQTDPRVTVSNSLGSPDSQVAGGWQVSGNTTGTAIAALDTFVDLNFTSAPSTALSFNERILLTDTINGEIQYTGKTAQTISIPLEGLFTTAAAATRRYSIKLVVDKNDGNGFLDTPDNIQPVFDVSSDGTKTSDTVGVFLEEGDLVKWQIAQITGALQDITMERGSLEISST